MSLENKNPPYFRSKINCKNKFLNPIPSSAWGFGVLGFWGFGVVLVGKLG